MNFFPLENTVQRQCVFWNAFKERHLIKIEIMKYWKLFDRVTQTLTISI